MKRIEFDALIMGRTAVQCAACGLDTVWRRPQQKTKGYCLDHAAGGDVDFLTALRTLLTVFPGSQVVTSAPRYLKRGEYAQWIRALATTRKVFRSGLVVTDRSFRLGAAARRRAVRGVHGGHPGVRKRRPAVLC